MGMFFLKRLGYLVLTMVSVSFIVFIVNEFTPGSAARKQLGPFATQEQVDIRIKELGLDRPVLVRYGEWLGNVVQGDLGQSTLFKQPVNDILWDRLKLTAILAAIAFVIIVILSIFLGLLAGMREGSYLDRTISVSSIVTTSTPEFASAVFLAWIFTVWLKILPGTSTEPLEQPIQFILPALVMILYDVGYVVRMVRASMVEVMMRPYIRTAILKGLAFRDVIRKHAFRKAMIAPFTVILLQVNYLVTGVVVVEAVFAFPGFGRMLLEGALSNDIALVQAGALVAVFVAVVTQIIGDVGYMMLNPRIRFS